MEKENLELLREADAFSRANHDVNKFGKCRWCNYRFLQKINLLCDSSHCSTDAMTADVYEMDFEKMQVLISQAKSSSPSEKYFMILPQSPPERLSGNNADYK